jgi:cysteine desulfurase/selenocysteine lyase
MNVERPATPRLAGVFSRRALGRAAMSAGVLSVVGPGSASGPASGSQASLRTPAAWREAFPTLDQLIDRRPLVYLDSAATTLRPLAVLDAIRDFYVTDNANPGSVLHTLARRAHERYEEARRTLARFLHAASPDEIVWVRGTTEGINLVASAWAHPRMRPGDEILLTVAEHASNLLPWRFVAQETGALVRYVDVDDEGRLSLADLERKLTKRTRLFAFSHVSNVAGFINPATEICALARAAGARVLVDAAQSAPHASLDVRSLGCDFLAFSSHKMLGPMGTGVLWARAERLEEMSPYQAGSNMAHDVDMDGEKLERGARRFGAGTPNVSGPIGLAAAVDHLDSLGRDAIERHEQALTRHALARLAEIRGLRLIGPRDAAQRIPVFTFSLRGWEPLEILRRLDAQGIATRAGDLSALPLLKRLGVTRAARASCYLYTRADEIDRLAEELQRLAEERSA